MSFEFPFSTRHDLVRREGWWSKRFLEVFQYRLARWALDLYQVSYEACLCYFVGVELFNIFIHSAWGDITSVYDYPMAVIVIIDIYLFLLLFRNAFNMSFGITRYFRNFMWINKDIEYMEDEIDKCRLRILSRIRLFISLPPYVFLFLLWILLFTYSETHTFSFVLNNNFMLCTLLLLETTIFFLRCLICVCMLYLFKKISWFVPFFPVTPNFNAEAQNAEAKKKRELVLKSLTITRFHSEEKVEYEQENCSICLCNFENNQQMKTLPCKHVFHPKCVDAWLIEHLSCPLCVRKITAAVVRKKKEENSRRVRFVELI
jgi:Ring finger domain